MKQEPILSLSHKEQLELLISRGLTVREPEQALRRLRQVNYARLKGYLLPFRLKNGRYIPGTGFERVYRLYVFDSRLRALLFPVLSETELSLRSNLSYYHGRKYGAFGCSDPACFEDANEHARFLRTVNSAVRDRDNRSFLEGHRRQDGKYPVWVVLELLSMGGLAHFYGNMLPDDRARIARGYDLSERVMSDWLCCLTQLRNSVAHYCRLYFAPFADAPLTPDGCPFVLEHDLFDYLYVARGLYLHPKRWNESLLEPLRGLISEYAADVELCHIGFPPNWYELLAK